MTEDKIGTQNSGGALPPTRQQLAARAQLYVVVCGIGALCVAICAVVSGLWGTAANTVVFAILTGGFVAQFFYWLRKRRRLS